MDITLKIRNTLALFGRKHNCRWLGAHLVTVLKQNYPPETIEAADAREYKAKKGKTTYYCSHKNINIINSFLAGPDALASRWIHRNHITVMKLVICNTMEC